MLVRKEENGHWEVKSIDVDYPRQRESNFVTRQSSESWGLEVIQEMGLWADLVMHFL